MRYLIRLFLFAFFFQAATGHAQYYRTQQAFQQAWPELAAKAGFWGNSYSPYRYYVGDINGDGHQDVISVVQTYRGDNPYDRVLGMDIELSRSADLYKRIVIPAMTGFNNYDLNKPEGIYLENIYPQAKNIVLHFRDASRPFYQRKITLKYNRNANHLDIVRDGGMGVLAGVDEEDYLEAEVLGSRPVEDLGNFDYIDQYAAKVNATRKRKTFVVKTRDDFFAALGDHREIILDMDVLDLSGAKTEKYRNVSTGNRGMNEYGYFSLFTDLTIKGKTHTDVLVDNETDDVWVMDGCRFITMENMNFYHLVPAGAYCEGLVMRLDHCSDVTLRNCEFNGSGMIGLSLNKAKNIKVEGGRIYNNSRSALTADDSRSVVLSATQINHNHCEEDLFDISNSEVVFKNCAIRDNKTDKQFFNTKYEANRSRVSLQHCKLERNTEKDPGEAPHRFAFQGQEEYNLGPDFFSMNEAPDMDGNEVLVAVSNPVVVSYDDYDDEAEAASAVASTPRSREEIISDYLKAEDSRDIDAIMAFFSPNMRQYWEQSWPAENYLRQSFAASWKSISASSNTVLGIKKMNDRTYVLHTYFEYTLSANGKKQAKESYVEYIFDDGDKLISVKGIPKP